MPKTPGSSSQSLNSGLGRNQACHRCRKKKLRCDAAKPCNSCIKAHAYALKHNGASALEPIDCSYDPPDELTTLRDIISGLQVEIAELNEKLKDRDALLALCSCRTTHTVDAPTGNRTVDLTLPGIDPNGALPLPLGTSAPFIPTSEGPIPFEQWRIEPMTESSPLGSMAQPPDPAFEQSAIPITELDPANFMVIDYLWPSSLPPPDVLHHLAETFFAAVPLASRIIHRPTFMASLQQPPSHRNFPQLTLLHAICALASIYTPVDRDGPLDNEAGARHVRFFHCGLMPYAQDLPLGPIGQYTRTECLTINSQMGFGATHMRWAAGSLKLASYYADRLIQVIQAAIICAWYNYSTGFHLNLYSWLGVINRGLLPMGLNTAPGNEPLSRMKPKQIMLLPGPWKKPYREVPRNLYWMAFSMERIYTVPTAWPLLSSEEDSSQLMPCTYDDFFAMNDVSLQGRQKLNSPGFLSTHPPNFTDSFSLYIKGSVLIGRVKAFNGRFRNRYSISGVCPDPRETTEFQMLDNTIMSYLDSIPRNLKDPVHSGPDGKLDPVLYTAHLLPHTAAILLHDPHANLLCSGCHSAKRLLSAARAILDLIYKLCATSYDLIYLDHACSVTWLVAGVVLVRFMKAALEIGNGEEAMRLKQEIDVIRLMLISLGQKTVIGVRQINLLDEFYASELNEPVTPRSAGPNEAILEDLPMQEISSRG